MRVTSEATMTRVRTSVATGATVLALFAVVMTAEAHDFWLVPNAFRIADGASLEVRGQTSSRFPTSESAVAPDRIADARVLSARGAERITDLSQRGSSLLLRHRPTSPGQRIVAVALLPRSMRESVASFRRYLELEGAPQALERVDREGLLRGRDSVTRRYAKYAKTIVEVGTSGSRAFSVAAGHVLEFVPDRDPTSLAPGDTLAVRLVYRGRPLAAAAVHAGVAAWNTDSVPPVSSRLVPPDIHLTTDASGVLRLPVAHAGLWNVRTIHVTQADAGSGADWDTHWATLVFLVGDGGAAGAMRDPGDSTAVAAVVARYHRALEEGDSVTALSLLAPDAMVLESGGVETRAEYRAHHLSGDIEFARAVQGTRSPLHVTVLGDAAWVRSTSVTEGQYRGRAINSAGAELMVLSRERDGWRIRAIHWSSRTRRPPG